MFYFNFYKLVYIKGISRFDTWRFSTKASQYNYFDGLEGCKIDDYFPPHYTNSIRFVIQDADYAEDNYNYCLLYFNNKYYCYFIDDIEYVNEEVYTLKLTMDSIQTYMFNIEFPYATVNRHTIKRWNDIQNLIINRHYQRENLSKEDFVSESYQEITNDSYGLLIKSTKTVKNIPQDQDYYTMLNTNGTLFTSGFDIIFVPLPFGISALDINYYAIQANLYTSGGVLKGSFTTFNLDIKEAINSPYVSDIKVVNNYFINKYMDVRFIDAQTTTMSDGTKFMTIQYDIYERNNVILYTCGVGVSNSIDIRGVLINSIDNDFNENNYIMPIAFTPNRAIATLFNKNFVPALLDENYIHIYYGEKIDFTTYPLSKSNNVSFKRYDYFDILTGERSYKILPNGENEDKYNTTIRVSSIEEFELFNDAWKTYKSQNTASLTMGRALSGVKTLLGVGENVETFAMSQTGRKVFNKTNGQHPAKFARALASPIAYAESAVLNEAANQLNYLETRENLQHTPNTVKQGNNYSSDVIDNSISVIKFSEFVKDIDNVAKLIEQFGYNVDLTYNNENLFNLNTRYYYNIVRCGSLKIDSIDCIIPEWIKQDICERFMEGLRLWNKDNNTNMIENIIYDNVENDFIQ